LAEHIRPESLPTGNSVATPAPIPGRRGPQISTRKPGSTALADPARKPSRVRAATEASAAAERDADRPQRPKAKPGWAKAGPRPERPGRPAGPRGPRREGDDRPERSFRPRDGEDRPKRPFKPRAEGAERPRGPRREE